MSIAGFPNHSRFQGAISTCDIASIFVSPLADSRKPPKATNDPSKKKKKEDKEMLVNIGDTIEKMRLVTRIFGERKGLPELGFNWI